MNPALGETIVVDFTTARFDTGAATDADSTPTCEVFEDDTDTALTITGGSIAKRTSKTGAYRIKVPCTAANGFEVGKSYTVHALATVNSVAGRGVVTQFVLRPVALTEVLEGSVSIGAALRIMLAALAGKSSGGLTSTNSFRDRGDTKARITATVDANGNRTAVTVDGD